MRSALSMLALTLATLTLLVAPAPGAWAEEIDDAKAAGWIGERPDGFLGIVNPDAPADVKKLVTEINARRKQKYAEIAKENGTAIDAVAALAGAKVIERTTAGQYVMGTDGRWKKK